MNLKLTLPSISILDNQPLDFVCCDFFSLTSPEACAAILWKSSQAAPKV